MNALKSVLERKLQGQKTFSYLLPYHLLKRGTDILVIYENIISIVSHTSPTK